jgi:hypothetical protein
MADPNVQQTGSKRLAGAILGPIALAVLIGVLVAGYGISCGE